MSIDTHSYPIPPQGLAPNAQRTSLQRGGFASMMDVLTQNEMMNQEDNDAFVTPPQESGVLPIPSSEISTAVIEKEESSVEVPQKNLIEEEKQISVEVQAIPAPQVSIPQAEVVVPQSIQPTLALEEQDVATQYAIPVQEVTDTIDVQISKEIPIRQASPAPKTITQIEVPIIEDVPEVIKELLPKILAIPQKEVMELRQPAQIQGDSIDVSRVQPMVQQPTDDVRKPKKSVQVDTKIEEVKNPLRSPQPTALSSRSLVEGIDIEEDPNIRFVEYVEKEVISAKFSASHHEPLDLPEGTQVQQDTQSPNVVSPSNVVAVETSARPVSVATRSEGVQAIANIEKSGVKEEPKLPRQKIQQSFAKLLKEAKDLADDFEPEFHAKILQKLEIQVKDPAGMIQLEIAQKEATIHVRAIVPTEAMSDLHYLGQDVQDSLQDMGLQLGSYELRSQDEENDELGFGGIEEVGFDDLETDDVESIHSDYIVDKRI